MKKNYIILAIDTSCDETSVAITVDDRVVANVVSSQASFFKEYGGVVPFLAKRKHQELIGPAIKKAVKIFSRTSYYHATVRGRSPFDAVAVTIGPGLAPALEVGVAKAKELAEKYQIPLIGVNHMEGHLLSALIKNSRGNGSFSKRKIAFPVLGLLVSGGHTEMVLMKKFGEYQVIGETLDDAAGECFDKVAKMLNLGYPGGPIVSELAKEGTAKYQLPTPMIRSLDLNFSFSGLKTACLYKLKKLPERDRRFFCDFSTSFVEVVAKALMIKLEKAIKIYRPAQIFLGGGVISNLRIRGEARKLGKKFGLSVFVPYSSKFLTDNAAMIGVCAYFKALRGDFVKNISSLDRRPNLGLDPDLQRS